jgi:hypothetical protein
MKSSNWLVFLIAVNLVFYWKYVYFEERVIEQIILRIAIAIFTVGYFIVRQLEDNNPKD